jgi:SAM-dependent methyltransferase
MTFSYPGGELEYFQHAVTWKAYYASVLRPFIAGDVLEVGAGLGGTSRFLCDGRERTWTCLEPDGGLLQRLRASLAANPLPVPSRTLLGTVRDLSPSEQFDTVLYIDVLEHIEDDRSELDRRAGHLRPGGAIIVLAPAHNWLFSPFDRAIGHYRRYSRSRAASITPGSLDLASAFYLDSAGMLASLGNRLLLRAPSPTLKQIRFWDSVLIPLSRTVDRVTLRRIGKTLVAIWKKTPGVP